MSKVELTINDKQVLDVLTDIAARFSDLSDPMASIAAVMESRTEESFETETSATTGSPWPELSENYLNKRPKRRGGKMLQVSAGGLAASIEGDSGDFWASIGSNKPYAAIHNWGGLPEMKPGPAAIPAREYLGINAEDEQSILTILSDFLLEN